MNELNHFALLTFTDVSCLLLLPFSRDTLYIMYCIINIFLHSSKLFLIKRTGRLVQKLALNVDLETNKRIMTLWCKWILVGPFEKHCRFDLGDTLTVSALILRSTHWHTNTLTTCHMVRKSDSVQRDRQAVGQTDRCGDSSSVGYSRYVARWPAERVCLCVYPSKSWWSISVKAPDGEIRVFFVFLKF